MYHYFFVIDSVVTHLLRDKCTLNIVHCSVHYSTSGDECLTMYGVPHSSAWDLWSNEVALLILTVAFLGLTYIQLRRTSLLKWELLPRLEWPFFPEHVLFVSRPTSNDCHSGLHSSNCVQLLVPPPVKIAKFGNG